MGAIGKRKERKKSTISPSAVSLNMSKLSAPNPTSRLETTSQPTLGFPKKFHFVWIQIDSVAQNVEAFLDERIDELLLVVVVV